MSSSTKCSSDSDCFPLSVQMKNDVSVENVDNFVNPWSVATVKNLLQKMNSQVVQYEVKHYVYWHV